MGRDSRKSKGQGRRTAGRNTKSGPSPRPSPIRSGRARVKERDGTRTVGRDSNCGTGLGTVGRDSNRGTGLEPWAHRDSNREGRGGSNSGTGLELWDGTRTAGRDSNCGTGPELWDGTRTVGRDPNCGTGLELWDGTRTVGRDSNVSAARFQGPHPSPLPADWEREKDGTGLEPARGVGRVTFF